jgi:hypothetical protein
LKHILDFYFLRVLAYFVNNFSISSIHCKVSLFCLSTVVNFREFWFLLRECLLELKHPFPFYIFICSYFRGVFLRGWGFLHRFHPTATFSTPDPDFFYTKQELTKNPAYLCWLLGRSECAKMQG